jgi:zinc protease
MFKGTERFKPGEFDKAMESMGAIINAATWKDFTFYYITGPKGQQAKNFDKALDMHADMVLFSTLPEEEIGEQHDPADPNSKANKRERGVVIEEIGMREDQPWTKIYNALNHMMYADGHPYQRDVIGSRQIIGNIPREEIVNYYGQWYSAQNLATIVVGDFDPSWLEERVLQYFNFAKRQHQVAPGKEVHDAPEPTTNGKRYEELYGDYQTSFFIMGFHGPKPSDLKETIAVDVASRVLGEGRSSRLYQALMERPKEPIFNAISCGQSTFKLGNVFFVQGNFNSPDTKACLKAVEDEVQAYLSSHPITPEEFQRAVKKMKVDFAETSETASGIAESIGESITTTGQLDVYVNYLNVLEQLTLSDVEQAAKRWFSLDKGYTAVLLPKGNA